MRPQSQLQPLTTVTLTLYSLKVTRANYIQRYWSDHSQLINSESPVFRHFFPGSLPLNRDKGSVRILREVSLSINGKLPVTDEGRKARILEYDPGKKWYGCEQKSQSWICCQVQGIVVEKQMVLKISRNLSADVFLLRSNRTQLQIGKSIS